MTNPRREAPPGTAPADPDPGRTGKPSGRSTRAARNRRIITLHREGHEATGIARVVGCSMNIVYRVLNQGGAILSRPRDRVEIDGEAVARAYAEGGTLKGVGRRFGVSRNVVERRVLRHGGKLREPGKPVRIAEVVRLYRAGTTRAKIAHRLGRGWRTIDIALRRVGIKPINGNYGGFADNTITWNAWSRQNRIKVQGWWEPLAKVLWKRTHGPVPPGCDVRRIDITLPRDRIDSLENLVMMNRRTQPARVWAAEGVPIPDDPIDRRETLILILTIAAVKAGDTSFKLGTW